MILGVRARLTLWYVSILAAVLAAVCILIYVLMGRALYNRIDDNLRAVTGIAVTSLANDLVEGQSVDDAARSTAAELFSDQAVLAIYDSARRLLAEQGRDDDLEVVLPPADSIPAGEPLLYTIAESDDPDDRHRMAVRHARVGPSGTAYVIVASSDLETTDEEMASLREILFYLVPAALVIAGIVGWFLANKSLAPVMAMAAQQRQFMADASHELRTPVTTARTAAAVALQQPKRSETEYRETLGIIEQQTERLTRVVDDMFTLARADAGNYPIQKTPMYLDELVDDVARGCRILAARRQVTIEQTLAADASFVGDEDLLKRMVSNLLDNAVRHAPEGSTVTLGLDRSASGYVVRVTDHGQGIPQSMQGHLFERFFRGDASRTRIDSDRGGAGLGLAIARWIARQHGGDVTLAQSAAGETVFEADLPAADAAQP